MRKRVSPRREYRPFALWILLLLAGLLACGGPDSEEGGGPNVPVRSDGVEVSVVESDGSVIDRPSGWRVAAQPDLIIGESQGGTGHLFSRISGVQVLRSGAVAVIDQGANEVHWFDPNGNHIASTGRPGEGPGEVLRPALVRSPTDDLTGIYDTSLHRITWFESDGSVSLIRTLEFGPPPPLRGPPTGTSDFGLFQLFVPACSRAGPCEMEVPYVWINLTSGKADTLVIARPRLQVTMLPDGAPFTLQVPFVASPSFAMEAGSLLVAEGKEYEVRAYDFSGEPLRVMRVDRPAPPLTREETERFAETMGSGHAAISEAEMRRLIRGLAYPSQLPAITDLKVSPSGRVFARLHPRTDWQHPRWLVFERDGAAVGYIETPSGLSVRDFGDDYVVGLTTDDTGRQSVARYRLVHEAVEG